MGQPAFIQDASREAEVETYRPLLSAIAYRMIGSVSSAEDIVQEAFLRLHRARQQGNAIESPKAYLCTIATRLAIDHLRSARVQRESYVGPWLPEPVIGDEQPELSHARELAESLSMAFMVLLETLTPRERAVFLLREVFDYGYDEIAPIVQQSEQNCRQIFVRAKRHIEAGRPRFSAAPAARDRIAERFFAACQSGQLEQLVQLLEADAAFYGDGGGKVVAAKRPVVGRERVAHFLVGIFKHFGAAGIRPERALINGQPGARLLDPAARSVCVFSLDTSESGILCIRSVVNPDKLRHLGPVSEYLRSPQRSRSGS
jgi:RNA polymerase sigma-70 factor (TIGR02957 family)